MIKEMRFVDMPIGTIFTCYQGKCKKISNESGRSVANAVGYYSNSPKNIHGLTKCEVEEREDEIH